MSSISTRRREHTSNCLGQLRWNTRPLSRLPVICSIVAVGTALEAGGRMLAVGALEWGRRLRTGW
jgi:hypothetical protein